MVTGQARPDGGAWSFALFWHQPFGFFACLSALVGLVEGSKGTCPIYRKQGKKIDRSIWQVAKLMGRSEEDEEEEEPWQLPPLSPWDCRESCRPPVPESGNVCGELAGLAPPFRERAVFGLVFCFVSSLFPPPIHKASGDRCEVGREEASHIWKSESAMEEVTRTSAVAEPCQSLRG